MQTALLPAAAGFSRSACPTPTWRDSGDAFGRARSACSCTDGPGPSSPFQSSYSTAITAVSGGPRSFRRSRLQALALGQVDLEVGAAELLEGQSIGLRLWTAATSTLVAGARIASLAIRLAQILVLQARMRLSRQQEQQQQQQYQAAEAEQARALHRERHRALQASGSNQLFMRMLYSLGNPAITLESKWASLCKHIQHQRELREHMGQLYKLSTESSGTLQKAMSGSQRPLGADGERAFFRSANTKAVIEQEAALRSLVFAQVLSASYQL